MCRWVYRGCLRGLLSGLCLLWTLVVQSPINCIRGSSHSNHTSYCSNGQQTPLFSLNRGSSSDDGLHTPPSVWRLPRQAYQGLFAFVGTRVAYDDVSSRRVEDSSSYIRGWETLGDINCHRGQMMECYSSFDKQPERPEGQSDSIAAGNGPFGNLGGSYSAGITGDQGGSLNRVHRNDVAAKSTESSAGNGEVTEEAKPGEITDEDIMKMKIALSQEATLGIDFVKCIETLQTSPYCTVSPTTIAYNATLSAAERNSNARAALAVVEDMRKKGNVLDGVSYKLATITCAKCGYISEALQLYDEMLSKGHSADHGVMRALMAQLAKEGNGMDCFRIYEDMKKLEKVRQSDEKFMQPEDYLKFIEAATKSEMYAEALQAYKEMKTLKNYNVTPVVITEVLTLCYGAGSWKEAMELYALLLKEKTAMTLYQYKLLLNIMFISRKYAEMDSIYNNMYKEGVNMDYMSYQLVLEGYAKTGQFHKALKVIEKMEPEGFLHGRYEPFIAAAEACRQSGEWKLALKLLRMAHDHNTNKCIIMYNTVLSIFAAAEEWDSIISIYNEIEAACKESSGSLHKLSMDGDTVAYAIMASFYTGDKTQVDKLLRLPVVETTLLLKLRKNINAEENAVAPTEVEGTQG